jgi:hypothetical protein
MMAALTTPLINGGGLPPPSVARDGHKIMAFGKVPFPGDSYGTIDSTGQLNRRWHTWHNLGNTLIAVVMILSCPLVVLLASFWMTS